MVDLSKPVRLRNGDEAGVYDTDGEKGSSSEWIGWCRHPNGSRLPSAWFEGGKYYSNLEQHAHDLVNAPETVKRIGYFNIYPDGISAVNCKSVRAAYAAMGHGCLGVMELTRTWEVLDDKPVPGSLKVTARVLTPEGVGATR